MDFCLLSKFDDLLSDIFLDSQFLWFDTTKLNSDHRRPRIRSDKVLKIIQDYVLATGKTDVAVKELLKMDYFRHYLAGKSTKQQQEFTQHLKRYLNLYMPDAGFEIADTRRYGGAGRRVEACVLATKDWLTGQQIQLCTGVISHLSANQEHELKKGNRDFNVMWSSRRNANCLFLGPARFVNHDCEPNAKFIALGPNTVTFKIIKDIQCGDELTAYYGQHYFGENNCECRCATCEEQHAGYFTPQDDEDMTPPKEEVPLTNSRKRKLSGTPEEPRRPKRSSLVCSSPIDLEKLIGDATQDHDGDDTPTLSPPPPTKRKEPRKPKHAAASGPPMIHPASSSPLSRQAVLKQASPAPSDEDERPQVMSIHFLCNDDETKRAVAPIPHASYQPPQDFSSSSRSSSISHSPLDLLCDAVLGTEYIQTHTKQEVAAAPPTSLTVVVPPVQEIKTELDHKAFPLLDHPDSAVGLSPLMDRAVKKPLTDDEDDDDDGRPLIKREKEEDTDEDDTTSHSDTRAKGNGNQGNNDDDFLDDVSDLSSVCSSDSDLDDDKDQVITPPTHPGESANVNANANAKEAILIDKPPRGSPNHHHSHSMAAVTAGGGLRKRDNHHGHVDNHEPCCVICDRPLKQDQKITDTSAAADVQVANELATWTWSPSAAFTDWNPQRCPRCERHSRVFGQEWPNRHPMPPSSSSSSSSSSSIAPTPTLNAKARRRAVRKQHAPQQHLRKASLTKSYLRSPPSPTSAIFDGVSSIF